MRPPAASSPLCQGPGVELLRAAEMLCFAFQLHLQTPRFLFIIKITMWTTTIKTKCLTFYSPCLSKNCSSDCKERFIKISSDSIDDVDDLHFALCSTTCSPAYTATIPKTSNPHHKDASRSANPPFYIFVLHSIPML
jgi:hypothetical protein